jgi:glycosyltransferase involved in cell wall biosynthesis
VLHLHELQPLLGSALARHEVRIGPGLIVAACSPEAVCQASKALDSTPSAIALIPNCVDVEEIIRRGSEPQNLGPGLHAIVCATADRRKGVDILTAAAALLSARSATRVLQLHWVGRSNTAPLPGSGLVHFHGELDDPIPAVAGADIAVLPSRVEAFGLAVTEAMALGKPVVASAVGGIPMQLGDAGLLVPPEDPVALADAIERLAGDEGLRRDLGARAQQRVLDLFDVGPFGERVRELARRAVADARRPEVVVLKSGSYGDHRPGQSLPYRVDLLERSGWSICFTDRHLSGIWRRRHLRALVGRVEATTAPFLQTVCALRQIRRSQAVLAMFESEGHFLALLRSLGLLRKPRFVVVACWLGQIVTDQPRRRRLYRFLYRRVDRVVVFSENQRRVLSDALRLPPERIVFVPFGVDIDEWSGVEVSDTGTVVAVGRDEGRDWPTLFEAVRGTGWDVQMATRPRSIEGLDPPSEVTLHGYVDRKRYRSLLASAGVVVIPTKDLVYPTGQTVLLEAMALGKPCIVTDTPAIRSYLADGVTTVGLADATQWRSTIGELLQNRLARDDLGRRAKDSAATGFPVSGMWLHVARCLNGLSAARYPGNQRERELQRDASPDESLVARD